MDLAVRAGKKVTAFFMYFVPGLDLTEFICGYALKRWGVRVIRIQHWNVSYYLRRGVFRPDLRLDIPRVTITDVEHAIREGSGVEWIAYGYKSIDSLQRRGMMNKWQDGLNLKRKICAPLKAWNNTDVLSYLNRRHIPVLSTVLGYRSSGINLSPECLAWLQSRWPDDYQRVLRVFPLATAQVSRVPLVAAWRAEKHKRKKENGNEEGAKRAAGARRPKNQAAEV
jgi:phosphoadenosine phosphosulfate reductase